MSLCSERPPPPRSPRVWTTSAVLEAMSDALCSFLDRYYFSPHTHENMLAHGAEEEEIHADDTIKGVKGGNGEALPADDGFFAPESLKAEIKLAAYEAIVLETPDTVIIPDEQECAASELPTPVALAPVALAPVAPTPVALAPVALAPVEAPTKKLATKKGKKVATKNAKSQKASHVPRAVALDAAASPASSAKPTKVATGRKLTSARKAGAKPLSVRV